MSDLQHDILCTLRSFRNGAFYGTKIRAPHGKFHIRISLFEPPLLDSCMYLRIALVMVMLFHQKSLRDKLRAIVKLTYEHTKNLAYFVGVYKSVLFLLKRVHNPHSKIDSALMKSGLNPIVPWHSAAAGAIGGYVSHHT
jgi:peroxisomal membrane protein 4